MRILSTQSSAPKLARLAAFFLGISSAVAQELPTVGPHLEDYLGRAQAANPSLLAFQQRYEAAMQRIPQASALPDPMLQVTSFVESVETRNGPQENIFMLSQRVPWFGKLRGRKEAASAEAEAVWYAWQTRQLMTARTVALGYFDYAYTGRAIALSRENLALLESLIPIVEERVHGGGELNQLLRLKVEVGKVSDRLQSLERTRVAQSARLRELLALPGEELLPWPEWEAPAAPETPRHGPDLAAALRANNPELAMLERKISSAEARREVARLESFPDLTLGVTYIDIGETDMMPRPATSGDDAWSVMLAVNLPLWAGRNRALRAEALSNERAAEHDYTERLNALQAELSGVLSRLEDAERRLRLYGTELLPLAEQALEISRTSYQSGRSGILEFIDSERSLIELQMQYWRAAADAWQQRITLQTLISTPMGLKE